MSAIGAGDLNYRWKRNGKDITDHEPGYTGVNTPTLTIISFSSAHVGNYTCTVKDSRNRVKESDPAQLDFGN